MEFCDFLQNFKEQRCLFVTTKGLSYLRNVQEQKMLMGACQQVYVAGSDSKSYAKRVLRAYWDSVFALPKKVTTVFVGFAPQLMLPLFWLYHRKNRFVAIDFFISLYDTMVCDRKKFTPGGLVAKILHKWDEATLKQADAFLADTKAHRDYFVSEFGADARKGCVLYLEADTAIYHPMDVARPTALADKYLVLYFGSVLPLQGVETVLAAATLCRPCPQVQFVFIGPLSKNGAVDKAGYPNIIFYDWLAQPELARQIAMADLCLAGHFNADIAKASRTIAGKTYIYKAMGKPVVLGENPANHELYAPLDGENFFVKMGDAQALADCIIKNAQMSTTGGRADG
ncbi:MAG: glycosyltransferase [Gemmiger sp.]|nr:glycosyltransferase [Gemmiger sp.]